MPRSLLLGRRRRSVTDYLYDDAGRLVRSVTTHDPEWTDDDRRWAMAWQLDQDLRCGGCGGNLDETTDEDYPFYYDVKLGSVCARCEAMDHFHKARDNVETQRGGKVETSAGQQLRVVEKPVEG